MPVTCLYSFTDEQQTSTLSRQKSRSIYSKLSVELTKFRPSFPNPVEVAQTYQKPNNAQKTWIYVFHSLRVKERVTNLEKCLKRSFFVFTLFMGIFNNKKISIKYVLTSNLSFINR